MYGILVFPNKQKADIILHLKSFNMINKHIPQHVLSLKLAHYKSSEKISSNCFAQSFPILKFDLNF